MVKDISSEAEFYSSIAHGLTFSDFYADWCGPCKVMEPAIKQLDEAYHEKVNFVKVDTDKYPEIAQKYGVSSIPRFIIFKDGKPVDEAMGAVPKSKLEEKLKKLI